MKTMIVSMILGMTVASTSFASFGTSSGGGLGPTANYNQCSGKLNDGTEVTFEVRSTAAPNVKDSVLVDKNNNLIAHLYCEKGGLIAPNAPSAGAILWNCGKTKWDRGGDGRISASVMRGGVTGATTVTFSIEQMFPLPAQIMGTLICN
ncbi:MAG TPA: hypothetical protein VN132_03485 [Bdellovibrio sp.]|nr:hypothetical protein [Bdellovibrio sp.]